MRVPGGDRGRTVGDRERTVGKPWEDRESTGGGGVGGSLGGREGTVGGS